MFGGDALFDWPWAELRLAIGLVLVALLVLAAVLVRWMRERIKPAEDRE